jgi:hypothetical protein
MAITTPFRDDEHCRNYSSDHLAYEIQMFYLLTRELTRNLSTPVPFEQRHALLESFAVHLRNLIDFFFYKPVKDGDVTARDFFDDPAKWGAGKISATLYEAKNRASKEVSHITIERKDSGDVDKAWKFLDLYREIRAVAHRFAVEASDNKLSPKVAKFIKQFYVPMCAESDVTVYGPVASASTTSVGLVPVLSVEPNEP